MCKPIHGTDHGRPRFAAFVVLAVLAALLCLWRDEKNKFETLLVDFVVDDMRLAIEAKATAKVTADHRKDLRALRVDHPRIREQVLVCLERRSRRTDDNILILPPKDFCAEIHQLLGSS